MKTILDRDSGTIQKNGDLGAISVTERSCTTLISKVERHISDRFCATHRCSVKGLLDRCESE